MKAQLNKEQITEIAELFEMVGDHAAITTAIKYGFKHPKLDYLLSLNNEYGWDDSWENTEILEEYLELKLKIFADVFKTIL